MSVVIEYCIALTHSGLHILVSEKQNKKKKKKDSPTDPIPKSQLWTSKLFTFFLALYHHTKGQYISLHIIMYYIMY